MGMVSKIHTLFQELPEPPKENLTSYFILGEIIDHMHVVQESFPQVNIPLLCDHLWSIRNKGVDPQEHMRGFLKVFEKTHAFQDAFKLLDDGMKRQLRAFISGGDEGPVMASGTNHDGDFHLPASAPVKHHFSEVREFVDKIEGLFGIQDDHVGVAETKSVNKSNGVRDFNSEKASGTGKSPKIFEDKEETRIMEVHEDLHFENWGQSVSNTPRWTFVPKTVLGLQSLVKWAKINEYRIRCSGYRHSWSSSFSEDKQILVSLLNLEEVNHLPDPMSIQAEEHIDPNNELKSIQLASPDRLIISAADKALVRVGVAVTNEQFRRWAVKNDKWTMPVDVILVEVTWGGVNGPICHGAGRRHKTVNDYVRAVEYVDANGEHRTISDPVHLKAAAGCFGLLGVVTHITFELDKMQYAVLKPIKPDIGLAIPPIKREDIPIALRKTFTEAQYNTALADFEDRASNDYYSEWFWFTRSQQAWVNTWNPTDDKTGAVEYPSPFQTWLQWVEGWLGAVITANPIFNALPGRWQAEVLATMGMVALPPFDFSSYGQTALEDKNIIKTALPNGLHFRRGIQNMRVRDLEFQIPIPGKKDDPSKPDYSVVQRAWWDIINLTYADVDCPMRLTMELRIMGSSDLLMAPQNGNVHGTASIEVLSIPDAVADAEWQPFLQRVTDLWLSYVDEHGEPLNVRPHWAKEWESINMRGRPAREYLREVAYKDKIPLFRETLSRIGEVQGWELGDLKKRFSNELWDYMVFSE
ncbi:hypothetical protein BJ878DRAFT_173318 [Calycina marina]|uniref:FAD-binding PCMH-type domain-containing protein n=1 Tax=Calycina marina TaxID=1763456 RepID=A0A9P7YZB3_9HELO|nr:hypothetical protein BJ878DRAFT_173318 [Calycina marina]